MTLVASKISLRPFRQTDANAYWESLSSETIKRLTGTHGTFTRDQIDNYVARQAKQDDPSRVTFVIETNSDRRAIGEIVINEIDTDNHSASIRIALFFEDDFGKGYGTEAMRLMVDYGFRQLHLHRITLGVFAFNPRAIHVYEKIGFVKEGVLRDALYWNGEYIDEITMSILEHEWTGLGEP